jgi:hypothetical protein
LDKIHFSLLLGEWGGFFYPPPPNGGTVVEYGDGWIGSWIGGEYLPPPNGGTVVEYGDGWIGCLVRGWVCLSASPPIGGIVGVSILAFVSTIAILSS